MIASTGTLKRSGSAQQAGEVVFTGVIESKSHEGGFLVSFTGSSPALESIIINSESGIYIGKVDAVLGNTDGPLAHVAHIDRKLDLDALIGVEVGIRAKKQREERDRGFDKGRRDDRRGGDRGYQSQDRQGGRFERNDRRQDDRSGGDWECPKCRNSNFAFRTECNRCGEPRGAGGGNDRGRRDDRRGGDRGYQSQERQGGRFERNDRGGRNDRSGGDWECPKCRNSNFAFRTECNRCGEPRGAGGGNDRGRRDDRRGGDRGYQSQDRQGGRFERNDRRQDNRGGGDWDCPKCRNSNFAFRTECNQCGLPRPGGARGGNDRGGRRDDRGRGGNDRGGRGGTYNDNDWDCPKCNNSNFAFRTECNRCGAPRSGGGRGGQGRNDGGRPPRRDDGGRPPRRDDRSRAPRRDDGGRPPRRDDRSRAPRRDDGGRPPRRDDGERPPRQDDGGRPPRRDGRDRRSEGGYGDRGSYGQDRPPERKSREPRNFRKSRGNGPGHAHNRPPKPIGRPREDDS